MNVSIDLQLGLRSKLNTSMKERMYNLGYDIVGVAQLEGKSLKGFD